MVDFASPRNLSFFDQVSLGRIPGWSLVRINGRNPDVDIGTTPEDIWNVGGLYPFQTTAQLLEVISTSPSDTAAGTGARTVIISGLDANYNQITEVVATNGSIVAAITTNSFLRVNRFQVLTAGSVGTNAGAITLRVSPVGVTQATISLTGTTGDGIAYTGVYTVPAGMQLWVPYLTLDCQLEALGTALVHFKARPFGGAWFSLNQFSIHSQGSSFIDFNPQVYLFGPEKADFRGTVTTVTTDNMPIAFSAVGILGPIRSGA